MLSYITIKTRKPLSMSGFLVFLSVVFHHFRNFCQINTPCDREPEVNGCSDEQDSEKVQDNPCFGHVRDPQIAGTKNHRIWRRCYRQHECTGCSDTRSYHCRVRMDTECNGK